jgi:type IV secretion system protein VirB5
MTPHEKAARIWGNRLASARAQAARWRWAAFGSGALSVLFAATLVVSAGRACVVSHVIAVEQLSNVSAVPRPHDPVQPSDAQIAYALSHFVEDIRSLSTDAVVVRATWARAYTMVTDRGAETLNAHAGNSDRFTMIGVRAVIAKVTAVIRASNDSFEIHWNETSFENESPTRTERFRAIVTVVLEAPNTEKALRTNPLGVYVHAFDWPRDVARVQ